MSSLLQVSYVVLPAQPLLLPPTWTAQVPLEAPAQVPLVVAAAHAALVPAILTAQVPMSAELQLAWEKVPVRDQALAQPALVPPGLTAHVEAGATESRRQSTL